MADSSLHRTRRRVFGAALVLLTAGVLLLLATFGTGGSAPRGKVPPVLRLERGGMLYTFHVPTGAESLYDLGKDPDCLVNLSAARPEEAAELRRLLQERLGVQDLEELRDPEDSVLETLRGLGYL